MATEQLSLRERLEKELQSKSINFEFCDSNPDNPDLYLMPPCFINGAEAYAGIVVSFDKGLMCGIDLVNEQLRPSGLDQISEAIQCIKAATF